MPIFHPYIQQDMINYFTEDTRWFSIMALDGKWNIERQIMFNGYFENYPRTRAPHTFGLWQAE